MKVAFFSTKKYDELSFAAANRGRHQLEFFEEQLNSRNAILAKGFDAVCVFVNDKVNSTAIAALDHLGIKAIAFRCAGYNNLNLEAVKKNSDKSGTGTSLFTRSGSRTCSSTYSYTQ